MSLVSAVTPASARLLTLLVSRPSEMNTSALTTVGLARLLLKRLAAVWMLSQTRDEAGSNVDWLKMFTESRMASRSVVSSESMPGSAFRSWNSTTPIRWAIGRLANDRSKASSIASIPVRPSGRTALAMLLVKSRMKTISKSLAVRTKKLVSV